MASWQPTQGEPTQVKPELCQWFVGCGNVAAKRVPHPAFPDGVPTCEVHAAWLEKEGD